MEAVASYWMKEANASMFARRHAIIPFRVKNMNNIVMRFEEDCHGETSQRCRAH